MFMDNKIRVLEAEFKIIEVSLNITVATKYVPNF